MTTPTPDQIVTCKKCGAQYPMRDRFKHRNEFHPIIGKAHRKIGAMERLHNIQLEIEASLKDLEFEREESHRRTLELDNAIAACKKLLINGTK